MKSASVCTGSQFSAKVSKRGVLLFIGAVAILALILMYPFVSAYIPGSAVAVTLSTLSGATIVLLLNKVQQENTNPQSQNNPNVPESGNLDRERIEFILDSLNDVFWSFDLTGKGQNYLSRSAEKMYGRPLNELMKEPFFWVHYIHPDDIGIQETCHRKLSELGQAEATYRIIDNHNKVRWIYSRARTIRDDLGKIVRLEGMSTDVSYVKQAEEIIEKQELQINAVVENLDMSLLVVSKGGKILLINKEAQEQNRKRGRDVRVGMNFFDLLSPDRKDKRLRIFEQIMDSKSTINKVVDYQDEKVAVRYYSVYYIPVLNSIGEVEQICIMSRDITSQKLADEKIKEKTELLRAVIDNLPDYVYVKDLELRHVVNNKANLKLIGANSEDETLGKTAASYFPNASGEKFIEDDRIIIQTGQPIINREEEVIDSEGRRHWLLTTKVPLKNPDGKVTGIVGISRDISERKQMDLSVHMSNERFRMASRATDDAIWDWDLSTESAYLGENFKELFGYDWGNRYVNLSVWSNNIHPDDRERVIKSLESAFMLLDDSKWQAEYRYICADGSVAHVCDRGYVIRDEAGNPVRMIGAMQNVTEIMEYRRSLEQKVRERTQELNKALDKEKDLVQVKSRFVSMASHEFRTPLSTIQFAAGFLKKFHSRLKPEELEKKLEGIENQVKLMTALLDDILTLGKTEAGKLKMNPVKMDLIEFFGKIIIEIENAAVTGHKVVTKFSASSLTILSEEKFLRNIFINLISNAIKFSPGKDAVYLTVETDGQYVSVHVRDEGIGIASNDLALIFEPFQRGSNVNNIEGTGLGLSIVKKAVETLGGEISADSKENAGSEFIVKLPLA